MAAERHAFHLTVPQFSSVPCRAKRVYCVFVDQVVCSFGEDIGWTLCVPMSCSAGRDDSIYQVEADEGLLAVFLRLSDCLPHRK